MAAITTTNNNGTDFAAKTAAKTKKSTETKQTNTVAFYLGGPKSTADLKIPIVEEKFRAILGHITDLHKNHRRIDQDLDYLNSGNPPIKARLEIKSTTTSLTNKNKEIAQHIKNERAKLSPKEQAKLWKLLWDNDLVTRTTRSGVSANFSKEMFSIFFDQWYGMPY